MERLIQANETYQIVGLCMEVYRILGFRFSEIVYKDALKIEALIRKIPAEREKQFDILYKGQRLKHKYFADFVMFEDIILEIKATSDGIADGHISQTLNYMKAPGSKVGLVIKFGRKSLEHKRLVL